MFEHRSKFEGLHLKVAAKLAAIAILVGGIACFPTSAAAQQPGQKTFSSAAEATAALVAALQAEDKPALLGILGPDAEEIISSGDVVSDKNNREELVQKYQQMHRLVTEPDGTTTIYIGAENWPMPIPLVQKSGSWYFDTAIGKQEVLYRRVGRNELAVIQVCHELVDAEKEYYSQLHDGDAVNQYAQRLSSDPGKHNGLYWQVNPSESESPIGPAVASAAADAGQKAEPFHGYYFRVLTGQGAESRDGAGSYIADGKMTRGFAFLAYPAEYRLSGVMTFVVNQDGIVYEKDLGPTTATIARTLTRYDPDATWRKAD